jgi:hypothetical protein
MTSIQQMNRFMLLSGAPFLGILILLFMLHPSMKAGNFNLPAAIPNSVLDQTADISSKLDQAGNDSVLIKTTIERFYQLYDQTNKDVSQLLKLAASQVNRPTAVFDGRIASALGTPIRQASSGNIDVKLYAYYGSTYNGYALKVNLKSNNAMQMVLGNDKLGGSETTLAAARRYGAIAAINAGGFADGYRGRYPTGNTIYNGKFIYGFFAPDPSVAGTFVGLSTNRKLIGGKFNRQAELERLSPAFGASFEPALLKNGAKLGIPDKWLSTPFRAPRTVIGNFKNDQLLILIANGTNESGSSGATLPELQARMQSLGIRDAYNLDGGGSTTLVFNGEVINKPSDGHMRPLPTHFLFFK